jgi:hypothetical protein
VESRASLDDVEERKFLTPPGLELLSLGCPARSQSSDRPRKKVTLYIWFPVSFIFQSIYFFVYENSFTLTLCSLHKETFLKQSIRYSLRTQNEI